MRALSAEETTALRAAVGIISTDVDTAEGAASRATMAKLGLRGCLAIAAPPPYAAPRGQWVECYNVTDLGRLALRVAVTIPPVLP